MSFDQWKTYAFWNVPDEPLNKIELPADLVTYQTYTHGGLPIGPICTPTIASIDAALKPDTKSGYLFFLAKKDGSNTHAFAKTKAEHDANRKTYGYT
jgi:cell division protein YceG involved in septum cleavage